MLRLVVNQKIHYTLRVAVAMCFIGHGAFGIITKPVWSNYFAVFGIGHDLAYKLMPVLGTFDILLGIILILYPVRAIVAWLVFWGVITALLRPLSGEPFAEFIERAGNFGSPLAFMFVAGGAKNVKDWFTRIEAAGKMDPATLSEVTTCLKTVVFLLFLGHGSLNIIGKEALLTQYASVGFASPVLVAQLVGITEVVAAFMVLIKPFRSLLFTLFIWKMASELLYPHYGFFEWIERGGSYGALLALWFITERHSVMKLRKVHAIGNKDDN